MEGSVTIELTILQMRELNQTGKLELKVPDGAIDNGSVVLSYRDHGWPDANDNPIAEKLIEICKERGLRPEYFTALSRFRIEYLLESWCKENSLSGFAREKEFDDLIDLLGLQNPKKMEYLSVIVGDNHDMIAEADPILGWTYYILTVSDLMTMTSVEVNEVVKILPPRMKNRFLKYVDSKRIAA